MKTYLRVQRQHRRNLVNWTIYSMLALIVIAEKREITAAQRLMWIFLQHLNVAYWKPLSCQVGKENQLFSHEVCWRACSFHLVSSLNWKRMLCQLTLQAEQRKTAGRLTAGVSPVLWFCYLFQKPFISLRDQADAATASKFQQHDSPPASWLQKLHLLCVTQNEKGKMNKLKKEL